MRPITLLPELGKLPSRILARRLTDVLHHKPELLNQSQRAYIKDGTSRQCISALIDVIEDFQSGGAEDLIVLSYDIRKAFDSVQHFTIRASCERLNLPESFIDYVLCTLEDATSQVRCRDGLTDPFYSFH